MSLSHILFVVSSIGVSAKYLMAGIQGHSLWMHKWKGNFCILSSFPKNARTGLVKI